MTEPAPTPALPDYVEREVFYLADAPLPESRILIAETLRAAVGKAIAAAREEALEEVYGAIESMHAESNKEGENDDYLEGLAHAADAIRALKSPTTTPTNTENAQHG